MHTAIHLSADLASAAVARRSVEWFTDELGIEANPATLVATELVANAVRHGAAPIVLHLGSEDAALLVEVSDASCGALRTPARTEAERATEGGLGLFLVGQLSRAWGVREPACGGKTVWAEVTVAPREAATPRTPSLDADEVVTQRGSRERRSAEYERHLAAGERTLADHRGDGEPFDWRASALHRITAVVHEEAATLHERSAEIADETAKRLVDRYR